MSRTPYASQVLADQIVTHWEDAKINWPDEPDGLGVRRRMVIEEPVAAGAIFDALLPIAQTDVRVVGVQEHEGKVVVDFSTNRHADDRTPFHLDKVLEVQIAAEADGNVDSGPSQGSDGSEGPAASEGDSEPPAKKAAKKTAKKDA